MTHRALMLALGTFLAFSELSAQQSDSPGMRALKATPISSMATPSEKQTLIYVKHLEPPYYPPLARMTRISGTVVMKLKVSPEGKVLSVESVGHKLLKEDAEKNIRTWTFGCVGCPSDAPFEHTINFDYRLDNEDVLPHRYMVMDLPDVLILYAVADKLNPSSANTNSKKGNN